MLAANRIISKFYQDHKVYRNLKIKIHIEKVKTAEHILNKTRCLSHLKPANFPKDRIPTQKRSRWILFCNILMYLCNSLHISAFILSQ